MASDTYGFYEVGPKPTLRVRCNGTLDLRGDAGSTVRFLNRGGQFAQDKQRIDGDGDLRVRVPVGATVILESVNGDTRIKGLQGSVTAEDALSGDGVFSAIDGDVTLRQVRGDLTARNVGGAVSISDSVSGDAALSHVGAITINVVHGDLVVKHGSGSLTVQTVYGDAVIKEVAGDVQLRDVSGDCALVRPAGSVTDIHSRDDIRIVGPLSVGKHNFESSSSIGLRYPAGAPLVLSASAPRITNRMEFTTLSESDGTLAGTVGENGPAVTLKAADRITLRSVGDESEGFESYAEVEFDMADLGTRISEEINVRMADVAERLGPELSGKAENALRRAQTAIDRAIAQMERNLAQAERKAERMAPRPPEPPKPPRPPRPPQAEPAKNTTTEQLKILKMLEDGLITVDEANSLLAALG